VVRYRHTEVADDQQRERISWQSLAASEVAQLSFPGSTLTDETHRDEGEGWGFDNTQLDAMLYRHWAVVAEPDDVMRWFREELIAKGWTAGQSHPFEPGSMGFILELATELKSHAESVRHGRDQGMVDTLANRLEGRTAVLRRHADRQLIRRVTTGRVTPITLQRRAYAQLPQAGPTDMVTRWPS
jgi:hypothetical protein